MGTPTNGDLPWSIESPLVFSDDELQTSSVESLIVFSDSKLGTSNIDCPATTNSEPVDYDTQDMAQTEDHTTPVDDDDDDNDNDDDDDDDDDDQIDIPGMSIEKPWGPTSNHFLSTNFDHLKNSMNKPPNLVKYLAQNIGILDNIHYCAGIGRDVTMRGGYYWLRKLYENQDKVVKLIIKISICLGYEPADLNMGLFQGPLQLVLERGVVDGAASLTLIPNKKQILEIKFSGENQADFILVVEKESMLELLVEMREQLEEEKKGNGIYITENKIPIYILVDCDPAGFMIAQVVKHSIKEMKRRGIMGLGAKQAKLIGLLPADLTKFLIEEHNKIALTKWDKKAADQMIQNPNFHEW
ncbi:hypothetical protein PSTT_01705, partial [Puccinia striiformis]